LGALGFAGISVWAAAYRPWLLGAACMFLCLGFFQTFFRKTCVKRSATSLVLFWTAVIIVVLVLLFPQLIASLLAG
jgi:hypothetical protein